VVLPGRQPTEDFDSFSFGFNHAIDEVARLNPPSDPTMVKVPREFPQASDEEKAMGWEFSYKFLSDVEQLAGSRTNYSTSLEATQEILNAALELRALLAQQEVQS